jgi:hypothetical protein
MKALLSKIVALIYPPTKLKLHRLITLVGYAFAASGIAVAWAVKTGLSTQGKIGVTIGFITTALAAWNTLRPKLDSGIDVLPIPDGTTITQVDTATRTTTIETPPKDKPAA